MNQVGIKNSVTDKKQWHFLTLYDFDRELYQNDLDWLTNYLTTKKQSYIIKTSLNGAHLIGFTPNRAFYWGQIFEDLQKKFPAYHDGQVIRLTKKPNEYQELLEFSFKFPFSINVAKLVFKKLELDTRAYITPIQYEENVILRMWYVLLMYNSEKNIQVNPHNLERPQK
jgi:hypothetical protein